MTPETDKQLAALIETLKNGGEQAATLLANKYPELVQEIVRRDIVTDISVLALCAAVLGMGEIILRKICHSDGENIWCAGALGIRSIALVIVSVPVLSTTVPDLISALCSPNVHALKELGKIFH